MGSNCYFEVKVLFVYTVKEQLLKVKLVVVVDVSDVGCRICDVTLCVQLPLYVPKT